MTGVGDTESMAAITVVIVTQQKQKVGEPGLMLKVCFIMRAVKDWLRACHLKTGIREKIGLLEICLKK